MSTPEKLKIATGRRVIVGRLERTRKGKRTTFEEAAPPKPAHEPGPARVALMLALAHEIQRAIDAGEVRDQAEAARTLGTTRARVTQLLDLTLIAPDLQVRILAWDGGRRAGSISERELRKVAHAENWSEQRIKHQA